MVYLIVFIGLFVTELIYFRIADRFNIIDKPNERSSHTSIVLRGGGIIFTIGLLLFFFTHRFIYPWFTLGAVTVAGISFADDVKPQPTLLRLVLQIISTTFLFYQLYLLQLFSVQLIIDAIAFICIVFLMNAYNFMDGINGITTGYSFVVLAALFYLNFHLKIFDNDAIIYLAVGNLVFFFFNFRLKAKCFAGDIGSIAMAFALLFFTVGIILKTNSPIFVLLFAVYAVDAGLTILHRLQKKENIVQPHRQHLYQYLANEKKWPQLVVSLVYMALQAIISVTVCLFWTKNLTFQWIFIVGIFVCLAFIYILAKRSILQNR